MIISLIGSILLSSIILIFYISNHIFLLFTYCLYLVVNIKEITHFTACTICRLSNSLTQQRFKLIIALFTVRIPTMRANHTCLNAQSLYIFIVFIHEYYLMTFYLIYIFTITDNIIIYLHIISNIYKLLLYFPIFVSCNESQVQHSYFVKKERIYSPSRIIVAPIFSIYILNVILRQTTRNNCNYPIFLCRFILDEYFMLPLAKLNEQHLLPELVFLNG